MKLRSLIFFIVVFLASTSVLAQVKNNGFEQGSGSIANSWTKFGNVFRQNLHSRAGSNSLKMYGNFSGAFNTSGSYQDIPLKRGQVLRASTWAYTPASDAISSDNYAVLKVIYRNSLNQDLVSSESRRINVGTTRDQFQFLSASLGAAPAGTDHASVFLLFIQPASTPFASGAVYFDEVQAQILDNPRPTTLVWSDEFTGTTLNPSNWEALTGNGTAYGLPAGWGNNEQQYYRPQNATVSGGLLRITAKRENFGGAQYTSARLRSLNKRDFLYGRFEARIKVVAGKGMWPAFWMLPTNSPYGGWASSGEIDIMETINTADRVHGTIHHGGPWPTNVQTSGSRTGFLFANDFHTYAIQWDPDKITWYLDDQEYASVSSTTWYSTVARWNQRAPFDSKFHILLNVAVGGNWPGNADATTPLPQEMQVDWVRVYQYEPRKRVPPATFQARSAFMSDVFHQNRGVGGSATDTVAHVNE